MRMHACMPCMFWDTVLGLTLVYWDTVLGLTLVYWECWHVLGHCTRTNSRVLGHCTQTNSRVLTVLGLSLVYWDTPSTRELLPVHERQSMQLARYACEATCTVCMPALPVHES